MLQHNNYAICNSNGSRLVLLYLNYFFKLGLRDTFHVFLVMPKLGARFELQRPQRQYYCAAVFLDMMPNDTKRRRVAYHKTLTTPLAP